MTLVFMNVDKMSEVVFPFRLGGAPRLAEEPVPNETCLVEEDLRRAWAIYHEDVYDGEGFALGIISIAEGVVVLVVYVVFMLVGVVFQCHYHCFYDMRHIAIGKASLGPSQYYSLFSI